MSGPKCLLCGTVLEVIHECDGFINIVGGFIKVEFGYGSIHDQGGGSDLLEPTKLDQLLNCETIRAYICDDCFSKRYTEFEGYNTKRTITQEKIVEVKHD